MQRTVALLALAAITLMPPGVGAMDTRSPAAATPVRYSPIPAPAAPRTDLLQRVQSPDCRYCRLACVEDFKIDCHASERWCRRQFVRCMRECWEQVCR